MVNINSRVNSLLVSVILNHPERPQTAILKLNTILKRPKI